MTTAQHNIATPNNDVLIHRSLDNSETLALSEQLRLVLTNQFASATSSWKMVGLMFYSIHNQTLKMHKELSKIVSDLAVNIQASGRKAPKKMFASYELSHITKKVDYSNSTAMVQLLIDDNKRLKNKARQLILIADSVDQKETADLLRTRVSCINENTLKLRSLIKSKK